MPPPASPLLSLLRPHSLALLALTGAALAAEPALDLSAPLPLADTIRLGATRNLALLSERTALQREVVHQRGAWQSYSPTLSLRAGLDRPQGAPPPAPPPAPLFSYGAGVSWLSPVGTVLSANVSMAQPFVPPGEPLAGPMFLRISQPLLKDAWLTGAALPLEEARLGVALQRELFRAALDATVLELETAYWDLAVAEADVEIKTRSRDRAQRQFEDTAENIRRGILADVEIYVPQENVVFFEQELVQANQNLGVARRQLATLLAAEATLPLRTAEPLARPTFPVPAPEAVLELGLSQNPQLVAQALRTELAVARARYAANQALPALDLEGSLSTQGSDTTSGGAGSATLTGGAPEAKVGLVFALPLDRGAVDATARTASLEAERQRQLLADERQRVRQEILDGHADLKTQLELLTLTERQVTLAELKLQAETDKYKNGISTLADVVRFQRDLDNASIRLRRVIRQVQVGRARLLAAQGTLHDAFGIELQ